MPDIRRLLLLLVCAPFVLPGAARAAAPPTGLDVAARLLDQPVGRPWAIDLGVTATVGDAAGAPRVPLRGLRIRFPHAHVNDTAFPSCSQEILDHEGSQGCPERARIGGGTALGDARPLVQQLVPARIRVYNGPRRGARRVLVFDVRVTKIVPLHLTILGTLRPLGGRWGYELDVAIPPLRTIPGAPPVRIARFAVTVGARHAGRSYLEAPRRCPPRGLPFEAGFTFAGGAHATQRATISCTLRASSGSAISPVGH